MKRQVEIVRVLNCGEPGYPGIEKKIYYENGRMDEFYHLLDEWMLDLGRYPEIVVLSPQFYAELQAEINVWRDKFQNLLAVENIDILLADIDGLFFAGKPDDCFSMLVWRAEKRKQTDG